jgi:hypothetical protein
MLIILSTREEFENAFFSRGSIGTDAITLPKRKRTSFKLHMMSAWSAVIISFPRSIL